MNRTILLTFVVRNNPGTIDSVSFCLKSLCLPDTETYVVNFTNVSAATRSATAVHKTSAKVNFVLLVKCMMEFSSFF